MRCAVFFLSLCLVGCASAPPGVEHRNDDAPASPRAVSGKPVEYGAPGGTTLTGYLARPSEGDGPFPGLIVIHEWWGLDDNVRAMTRRLAGEGYAALAVDLYGGRSADDPDLAHDLMVEAIADTALLQANLAAAHDFLGRRLRAPRVGTIGWSFGAGWSLNTALAMPESIDAVVIYYGRLESDRDRLARLGMPLLGLFGGRDRGIPVDTVRAFERTVGELGIEAEVVVYDDAGHAFANPTGTTYEPEAARDAWSRTVAFLSTHLGSG